MVVKLDEIRKAQELHKKTTNARAAELEQAIDMAILRDAGSGRTQTQYPFEINEPSEVIEALVKRYTAQGYSVKRFHGSQWDACNDIVINYGGRK